MKGLWILGALTLLIVAAAIAVVIIPAPAKAPTQPAAATTTPAGLADLITVDAPLPGGAVSSPLTITGKARGNFYFEAVFPVVLVDATGNVIAQGQARAQSDWMTTQYVPFAATLAFAAPASATGTLIIKNDNPSGDPSRDKTLRIPVVFR